MEELWPEDFQFWQDQAQPDDELWLRILPGVGETSSDDSCSVYAGKMTFLPNGSSYLCHSSADLFLSRLLNNPLKAHDTLTGRQDETISNEQRQSADIRHG
jgi:hypothetical protein